MAGRFPLATKTNQMDEGRRLLDVWSGLGVTPHPAIYYVVTAPLDLDVIVRSPLVLTRTAALPPHRGRIGSRAIRRPILAASCEASRASRSRARVC